MSPVIYSIVKRDFYSLLFQLEGFRPVLASPKDDILYKKGTAVDGMHVTSSRMAKMYGYEYISVTHVGKHGDINSSRHT